MALLTRLRDLVAAKKKTGASSLSDNASRKDTTSKCRKRLSPPRQHIYIPSTEYLPNHNLALHKILPSNPPPPEIRRRIDFANARREYARQEHEQNLEPEVFWVPARPARPSAAHLPPVAPDEIPVFHFPIASQEAIEMVEVTNGLKARSNSRRLRTRRIPDRSVVQCPRPQQFRRRVSFERAYVRHVQLYSQRQQSATKGSLKRPGTGIRSATTSIRDVTEPLRVDDDDDSFYWDDSMPVEQAAYVQAYVQQAAMDNLIGKVVEAYP